MSSSNSALWISLYAAGIATASLLWQWRRWRLEHGIWAELTVLVQGRFKVPGDPNSDPTWDIAIRVWNRGASEIGIHQMALDPNLVRWFDRRYSWIFIQPVFARFLSRAHTRRYVTGTQKVSVAPGAVRFLAVPVDKLRPWGIGPDTRVRGVVWLTSGPVLRSRRMMPEQGLFEVPEGWLLPGDAPRARPSKRRRT
jgi:hypothetical protein